MSDSYLRVTIAGRERIDWRIFLDFFRLPQKRPDRRPLLFAVLDLLVLLDQAKSTRKTEKGENFPIDSSGSIPHLRLGVSCEERIYHLLSPKGGAKSVRRVKNSGTGRRLAPKTLRGRARARVFDGAAPPVLLSDFPQGGATVRFGCVADSAG